jgi:SAM-dependent methyltransferase
MSSNGWEERAGEFIAAREKSIIGVDVVRAWSQQLPKGAAVLDLGCGFGVPISQALINDGFTVYGVDASPTLVEAFRARFPQANVVCEPAETSGFFGRTFDGVVAVGLMFLLSPDAQRNLILRVARALNPGGSFLFSSPSQVCSWTDITTGRESRSLGTEAYLSIFSQAGLTLVANPVDAGQSFYFQTALR